MFAGSAVLKTLDANVKRNTAFIKKLRTIKEDICECIQNISYLYHFFPLTYRSSMYRAYTTQFVEVSLSSGFCHY